MLTSPSLIQLSRATNESTQLQQGNAHLKAAETMVQPMDDAVAAELNDLGNRLDEHPGMQNLKTD